MMKMAQGRRSWMRSRVPTLNNDFSFNGARNEAPVAGLLGGFREAGVPLHRHQ
jgi:hypothetical protein